MRLRSIFRNSIFALQLAHRASQAYAFNAMLIRVRSNAGTWKYEVCSSETISDVLLRIQSPSNGESSASGGWMVSQPLSKDPAGKEPLAVDRPLQELELHHGAMIYCRVEQRDEVDESRGSSQSQALFAGGSESVSQLIEKERHGNGIQGSKEHPIIDLLDSDDEDGIPSKALAPKPPAISNKRAALSSASTTVSKRACPVVASKASQNPEGRQFNDFTIASYNVWFGPPDPTANQVHPVDRMKAISQELRQANSSSDLLFVGFQELTDSLRQSLEPHLREMGFKFCTQPLGSAYGVGLAISRQVEIIESKFLPFSDSAQGRGLLYVQTATMLFGTTHLESFVDSKTYNGVVQREAQLVQAAMFCQDRLEEDPNLKVAMIAGDFNWDDERKRKGTAPNTPLQQLLREQGCGDWKDPGTPFDYTYDGKENPMLSGNLRRRFDRCIHLTRASANSSTARIEYEASLTKLGMDAIPKLTWNKKNPYNGTSKTVAVAPSDHFGIAVKFKAEK